MKVDPKKDKKKILSKKPSPAKETKEESPILGPPEEDITIDISEEERFEVIDKYLMGEPIEKDYVLFKHGDKEVSLTIRATSAEMTEYADRILYQKEDISMAEAMTENNNNLIGVQIAKFIDKDFVKDQGKAYNTKEGIVERIDYMKKRLILPVRSLVIEKMKHFQAWCSEIFSPEGLKNF